MSDAQTITNNRPHPGMWLKEEFLEPLNISAYRLAKDIGVQQSTITRLIHGQSRITPNLALRFEKYFSLDAEFWLNIQKSYDLMEARANEIIPEIKSFNLPSTA